MEDQESREWLLTNGIGGFASGTISGILTRRYHGLLVAALDPPLGRTLLVPKCEETIQLDGKDFCLSANRWQSGAVSPDGYQFIERFRLDGNIPVWTYAFHGITLEKKIWMRPKSNTTYVQYELLEGSKSADISIKIMANYRGYHATTHAGGWKMNVSLVGCGFKIEAFPDAAPIYVFCDRASGSVINEWYYGYFLKEEQKRGLPCTEDHLLAGIFHGFLQPKEKLTLVFSLDASISIDRAPLEQKKEFSQKPFWIRTLISAADAFIVDRPPDGKTVIAGYHWFGDWGRDTMISLPGLTLTTGRSETAKTILKTFSKTIDRGMLPNRFLEKGKDLEYNTVDASLWYFEAIRAYAAFASDKAFIEDLFPILSDMIDWHIRGTRYNIHADPKDGLLFAGENGVQLTWMDAKIGDWVVTPRTGKPIEVNALWLNALKIMGDFARLLKKPSKTFDDALDKAKEGFQRFWNESQNCCFDVLDGPDGHDAAVRPNQIFAVSLPINALAPEKERMIVEKLSQELYTPRGLRSLSCKDSRYRGRYEGAPQERDAVYHQGTVWAYLLGSYALSHFKVFYEMGASLKLLEPMADHLLEAGLGTVSEIFDGDPPHAPRGCIAQAWSVAEILRAWHLISEGKLF